MSDSELGESGIQFSTLTQLIARGKALNTVKGYTNHLQRLYKLLHEHNNSLPEDRRKSIPPYDDYHWLEDRDAVRKALKLITPDTCVRPTVSAIRGTLRPIVELFDMYKQEQEDFCHNSRSKEYVPSQSYTQKEEERWVNLKKLKHHVKSYEPALAELHKRRRACKPQSGWAGTPFVLEPQDKRLIYKHLALSLYCNQPPVRLDMADLFIYYGTVPQQHKANYLLCPDPGPENNYNKPYPTYTAYWTVYKTAKFKKDEGPSISVFKPKVCRHLYESLQLWPRTYVLTQYTDSNKPLGRQALSKLLSEAGPKRLDMQNPVKPDGTENYVDSGLGCNMLRHIYISDKMKHQMPESKRKELADAMHHTVDVQRGVYERH